jgi:hypothetical protein
MLARGRSTPRAGFNCREDHLSFDDRENAAGQLRRSPTGPRVAPPRMPIDQPPLRPPQAAGNRRRILSVAIFILIVSGVGIRAYRDLSRPEAWSYWRELYFAPSMTSSLVAGVNLGGSGGGRPALVISGTIGDASASWFRGKLGEAHLVAGDAVLLSSPGGSVSQAIVMGEMIRSRGLVTAVGVADASGRVRPSYCASACVLVYAGGKTRFGIEGSKLGVHRFATTTPGDDPVADAQRIAGMLLGYMTRMGVSSSVVEAMSQTRDVRWIGVREAAAMNLVTDPVDRP